MIHLTTTPRVLPEDHPGLHSEPDRLESPTRRRGLCKWLTRTLGLGFIVAYSLTSRAASPALECFPASDLDRVFEDGYGAAEPLADALRLFGLRNETISAQCVHLAHEESVGFG